MFNRLKKHIESLPALEAKEEWDKLLNNAKVIGQIRNIEDPKTLSVFKHELEVRTKSKEIGEKNIVLTIHFLILADIKEIEASILSLWNQDSEKPRWLSVEALQSILVDLLPAELEFLNKLKQIIEHFENVIFSHLDIEAATIVNMKVAIELKLKKLQLKDDVLEINKEKNHDELAKLLDALNSSSSEEKKVEEVKNTDITEDLRHILDIFKNKEQVTYLVLCQELEYLMESFINLLITEIRDQFFKTMPIDTAKEFTLAVISKKILLPDKQPALELAVNHLERFLTLKTFLRNENKNPLERLQDFYHFLNNKNKKFIPFKNKIFENAEKAIQDHMKIKLKDYKKIRSNPNKKKLIAQLADKFKSKTKETKDKSVPTDEKKNKI